MPAPDSENLGPLMPAGVFNKIGFAIESGAYFVETNGERYRLIGAIENTAGICDGAVPYVIGSSMALPSVFTVPLQTLRDVLPGIVDASEPGAYAGLDAPQTEALHEATRMGFPLGASLGHREMGIHGLAALSRGSGR